MDRDTKTWAEQSGRASAEVVRLVEIVRRAIADAALDDGADEWDAVGCAYAEAEVVLENLGAMIRARNERLEAEALERREVSLEEFERRGEVLGLWPSPGSSEVSP